MKKTKKLIALAIVLVMCLSLFAACTPSTPADPVAPTAPTGPGDTAPPPPPPDPPPADGNFANAIDIIVDNNNIAVLDPFNPAANQASTNWVFTMIYDRLLNIAGEGQFDPGLATSWHTDDYQTFTLTLRDDVVFHNGDPLTAEDVRWTVEASRDGIGSQARDQWLPIETVNVLGTHEIQFVLGDVNVDFWFNLAMPMAGILNQRAIAADPENGSWIGTGAFSVERFVSGDYVVLSRNDNWWNTDRDVITEQVTMRFVPEVAARAIMLQNLESQLSFGTGAEDTPPFQASPDFEVRPLIFNNPQGISFNMQHPITGCWYFRMAVAHAMDRDEIAMVAAGEWAWGEYRSGTLWGYESEFRNDTIPQIPFDLDLARYYLERSVYNGETIEIATAIVTNIRASQAFQAQMADIGINIEINDMDSASLSAWMRYGNEDKQMSFFNSAMSMNAGSVRHIYYPGGGQNRGSYNNPEITQMLDEARSMTDVNQRRNQYMEIQRIIAEDPPIINVFWRVNAVVSAAGVGGFTLPSDHHHIDLRGIFWDLDA